MRVLGIASAALLGLAMVLAGCETDRGPRTVDRQEPTLKLTRSHSSILVGETTTVFAETANLLGRDSADIRWSATLGEIRPDQNGRIARFSSDQPGTAVITAEMNVDGRILRSRTNVTVNALR